MGRNMLHLPAAVAEIDLESDVLLPAEGPAGMGQGKLQGQWLEMYPFPFPHIGTKAHSSRLTSESLLMVQMLRSWQLQDFCLPPTYDMQLLLGHCVDQDHATYLQQSCPLMTSSGCVQGHTVNSEDWSCVTRSQNGFGVAHQRAAVRKLNSVERRRAPLSKEVVNFTLKVRKILNGGKMGSFSFFVAHFLYSNFL